MLIGITAVSAAVALVMTFVAWRATTAERRRAEARVLALAREIHGDAAVEPAPKAPASRSPIEDLPLRTTPDLFTTQPARSGSRHAVALAAAGFVVASVAAAAIVFGGGIDTAAPVRPERPDAHPAVAATAGAVAPLELIALTHERAGDEITVRGVVRNPATGSPMDRLTAVISLYDASGALLTTARDAVESPALIPGGESTFSVTVPLAADVGRYRVSFRSGDRIVSHIDMRRRS